MPLLPLGNGTYRQKKEWLKYNYFEFYEYGTPKIVMIIRSDNRVIS